jgi:hypothetical protein
MRFLGRLSLRKRFRSPAALAAFGAFAVPEPFGAIILLCAAVWWWHRRRRKGLAVAIEAPAPMESADTAPLRRPGLTYSI